MRCFAALLLCLLAMPSAATATIQDAVDLAADGDTVFVSPGLYTGSGNRNITFGGKNLVLLAPAGPAATIIDCQGVGRGFVFGNGEDTTSVVDGFTIRNADATTLPGSPAPGGAVFITNHSGCALRNCILEFNTAGRGGGVFADGNGILVARDCVVRNNIATDGEGGGIDLEYSADGYLDDCDILDNQAPSGDGGGVSIYEAGLTMRRCTVAGNSAYHGGGLALLGLCLIEATDITGNTAAGQGGGVSCSRTGLFNCGAIPILRDCTISENTAVIRGGGLGVECFELENCTLAGNSTPGAGGGLVVQKSYSGVETPHATGCTVTGNLAGLGGGVAVVDIGPADPVLQLTETTLAGNRADHGGGLHLADGATVDADRVLIWENCGDISGAQASLAAAGANLLLTCSAIDTSGIDGPGAVTYSGSQVFADPLLCAPASCSSAPTTAGDYRLAGASPCLPGASPCGGLIGALGPGCSEVAVNPVLPAGRVRLQAYPNPFRDRLNLVFTLPESAPGAISVFDVRGRRVRSFAWDSRREGLVRWDGRDAQGREVPPGVYFIRLGPAGDGPTQRVVLLP